MPEQTETIHLPNVKLTLTCGNAKCKQVLSEQIVAVTAAPNIRQVMSTQRLACPHCMKVGRCHVVEKPTDVPLTGGDRTVETAEGTLVVTPRSHKPNAADRPRRDGGNANRNKYTAQERGSRRRQSRAAGKTAVPPMSARQREKLERRGQTAGVLVAESRSEVERARTNQPQVPTLQPAPGQRRLPSSRAPAPSAQPRTRSADARAAGLAASAASLAAAGDPLDPASVPVAPVALATPVSAVAPVSAAGQTAAEKKAAKRAAKKAARKAEKAEIAAAAAAAQPQPELEPLAELPSQPEPTSEPTLEPAPEPTPPTGDVDISPTNPETPAS